MNYKFYSEEDQRLRELKECAALDRFVPEEKLCVKLLHNAIVLPEKGVYHYGKLLSQSFWGGVVDEKSQFSEETDHYVYDDSTVYYIGTFHPCWGHEITDGMRLLWGILPELGGMQINPNIKCAYTLCNLNNPLTDNFRQLLSYIGITETNLLLVTQPTKFKSLYLADEAYWYNIKTAEKRTFSKTYRNLFEAICKRVESKERQPTRTIYFSRSAWKKGNPDFGERYIENCFKKKGNCEIYHPEKLSFDQMVKILRQTKTLITTEGSISHNALFMQPGSNIVLIRKAGFISYYQLMINQLKELNVTYIDAHRTHHFYDKNTPYYGPFFLYVNKPLATLLSVKSRFPVFTYIHYRSHIIINQCLKSVIRILCTIKHKITS